MIADYMRLRKWMKRSGYTSESLTETLGYEMNVVEPIVNGKRHISRAFRRMFARRFGEPMAFALFKEPIPYESMHTGTGTHPEREASYRTLCLKASREEVPPAKSVKCYNCDNRAVHNHHDPHYHPDNALCVVPLCRSCHMRVHAGSLKLDLGIVSTRVGVIRIAIATMPGEVP